MTRSFLPGAAGRAGAESGGFEGAAYLAASITRRIREE